MRHGETDWNRDARVMGALEIPLNATGEAQCAVAGELLSQFAIDRICSSPMLRARQSAQILSQALSIDVEPLPGLEEVCFGDWQGLTYAEILDDERYAAFSSDPINQPTPGGETIAEVQARGLACLETAQEGEAVVFVSHGDILRSILCYYLNVPLVNFRRLRVDNSGLSCVVLRGAGVEVKFLNSLADPSAAVSAVHWQGRS